MAIQMTTCKICSQALRSNGKLGLLREVQSHFVAHHPQRWLDYTEAETDYLKSVKEATIKLAQEANKIITDPNLLLPERDN